MAYNTAGEVLVSVLRTENRFLGNLTRTERSLSTKQILHCASLISLFLVLSLDIQALSLHVNLSTMPTPMLTTTIIP